MSADRFADTVADTKSPKKAQDTEGYDFYKIYEEVRK